jgi:hypothetical protein
MENKKRHLIVYVNDNRMETTVEKEFLWKTLLEENEKKVKVREINVPSRRLVEYEDGTVIEMIPVVSANNRKHTHLYVARSIFMLKNYENFMNNMIQNSLKYEEEDVSERVGIFHFDQSQGFIIRPYNMKKKKDSK